MKLVSYWLDTAPAFHQAAESLPEHVDVAVIGGGFTGLSSALALARSGASVALFEAGQVVGEASGRNGGQCNNGTAQSLTSLIKSHGLEKARSFYQSFNDAVDSVEALVDRERIDCEFRRCGKLKLAAKPEHFESLKSAHRLLKQEQLDPNIELLTPADLPDELALKDFHGGLLYPKSAQLHVGQFGVGLAQAAQSEGVHIFQHTPVSGIERLDKQTWKVTSGKGVVRAKQILVATGGSGSGPFGWFRRRVIPVGSFAVVTQPISEELTARLFPKRRNYVTTRHIGNYFRLTSDRRLLFGGRARFAISNPKTDEQSSAVLRESLAAMIPELKDIQFDYCWGGSVDMTADRLPRAGQHKGMYYAMGYSGHGVQMAVHMGGLMCDLMQGRSVNNPWLDEKWPAIPGYFGKPWFLPAVGMYYKILDRFS